MPKTTDATPKPNPAIRPDVPVVAEPEPEVPLPVDVGQEIVTIEHPDVEVSSNVTRAAYESTWKDIGWSIVRDPDELVVPEFSTGAVTEAAPVEPNTDKEK